MTQSDAKIALLIDADNAPAAKIDLILSELAKYGMVNIRRAYGNWKSTSLQSWENMLHEYAIRPIQQFDYTKGKNATDMALVIEAMDLLYTQKLDAFGIVSSDCDFTPLVLRIRTNGHKVYGFGEKKTPAPFVKACSKFTYLEALGTPEDIAGTGAVPAAPLLVSNASNTTSAASTTTIKKTANGLKGDTRLILLLRNAVDATAGDDGWAGLGAVGQHISNQASFDSRNYGYSKLSDLFAACGLFETSRRNGHIYVRDKKASNKPQQNQPAQTVDQQDKTNTDITFSAVSLQIKYKSLLCKKKWKLVPKSHLLTFHSAIRAVSAGTKQEILEKCQEKLANTLTQTETKSAFAIFLKSKLFDVTVPPNALTGSQTSLTFLNSPDFLRRIDAAMLARLLTACRETGTPINIREMSGLLYEDHSLRELTEVVELFSNEPTLKG
jgi:uncharacterized LabA/DUF88 family protein